jgi:hypothetical protein
MQAVAEMEENERLDDGAVETDSDEEFQVWFLVRIYLLDFRKIIKKMIYIYSKKA